MRVIEVEVFVISSYYNHTKKHNANEIWWDIIKEFLSYFYFIEKLDSLREYTCLCLAWLSLPCQLTRAHPNAHTERITTYHHVHWDTVVVSNIFLFQGWRFFGDVRENEATKYHTHTHTTLELQRILEMGTKIIVTSHKGMPQFRNRHKFLLYIPSLVRFVNNINSHK